MNIYIAGPMTGKPELNFPAFFSAEEHLRKAGHNPINPARLNQEVGMEHDEFVVLDLEIIAVMADAIALLPGWEQSVGAYQEYSLAIDLKLQILHFKWCKNCGQYLIASRDNFSHNYSTADRLCPYCKKCNNQLAKDCKARRAAGDLVDNTPIAELAALPAGMKRGSLAYCKWHNEQFPILSKEQLREKRQIHELL